ncbi:MAG: hypothetical protein HOF01_08395 [Chloroflexi bacterium]|nr:hypothetical protein [Chloroflexota bacterium]
MRPTSILCESEEMYMLRTMSAIFGTLLILMLLAVTYQSQQPSGLPF